MRVERFTRRVPDEVLGDLRERLARTRWSDALEGTGWSYGADVAAIRELAEYWRTRFDWRAQERAIFAHPHYRATIQDLGIHFVHVRGRGPRPLPLIVTHGWPGSFLEMLPILPRLTDPQRHGGDADDAFDVVVPSLPGYGFSDRPRSPGMNAWRIADLWAELMGGLGYERFGTQGGDWGASVSTRLAAAHPSRVVGLHLNYIPGSYRPDLGPGTRPLSEAEQAFLRDEEAWRREEGAYGDVQRTRPQTLAIGINDSPAGLLAWIVEKFRAWADCGGDLERRFTKDDLLANVTLYWVTGTFPSSIRLYYESALKPIHFGPGERVPVPCGVARFPLEAPFPPRDWVERCYDVARWTEMPRGGHFAALEEPDLLAEDIRAFFRPLRRASAG
ncbi:MAG TPA: epoxide hydrolase [Candidatus Polarisedimenticolia bacterium]|nr:epoxide hydrolase [Candidatus Polarisedimenticolia bacterium]